ncbi:phasin family protein [Methylonatrum kenyense]|uniref:phasin family protein n=1 Tax=Methylonatrum kenyense TaxID=455253 RepID=UPI0020BF0F3C|nr:phasin family protein [Methylonatrum kenyense]
MNKQIEEVTAPVRAAQEAFVEHLASLTEFHVDAVRGYSELGLNHLRAVQGIDNPQTLITTQNELLKTLGERVSQDLGTLSKLQQDYVQQVQGLAAETAKTVEAKAEKTVRKTASTSRGGAKKTA